MMRPGPFTAAFSGTRSEPVWVHLVPALEVSLTGVPTVGSSLRVVTHLVPPGAGILVEIDPIAPAG